MIKRESYIARQRSKRSFRGQIDRFDICHAIVDDDISTVEIEMTNLQLNGRHKWNGIFYFFMLCLSRVAAVMSNRILR